MARRLALTAALVSALLPVSGAGGAPAQAPKRGGTLVIGVSQEPVCLNPVLPACWANGNSVLAVLSHVLPGFVEIGPDLTFRPALVRRASASRGPRFAATYHLDPRARWSDGRPITAADVVFSHRLLQRHNPLPPQHPASTIQRVVAVDDKTVRIEASRPYWQWRFGISPIVPRHVLRGRDVGEVWKEAIDDPRTGRPIGSGPFLVQRWERGQRLTLVRNPRYWAGTPRLDRVVIRFLRPGEYVDALRNGVVDVLEPVTALGQAAALQLRRQRPANVRVDSVPGTFWEHVSMRIGPGGHPALRNKLVRRALAYGIDRVAIARSAAALLRERAGVVRPLDSVVHLTSNPAYRANWGRYRYDPSGSRRLLGQAGCRRGADGIYSCAGDRLSLRFATTAGAERREQTVRLAQTHLRAAGIEIVPTFAPAQAFFGQILPSGAYDLALFAFGDATDRYDIFACGNPLVVNFTGYCQRLTTRDLDQARSIIDASRRARVLNRADRRIAADVPVIPIFQNPFQVATRADVRGVVPNPAEYLWNIEDWWLER